MLSLHCLEPFDRMPLYVFVVNQAMVLITHQHKILNVIL